MNEIKLISVLNLILKYSSYTSFSNKNNTPKTDIIKFELPPTNSVPDFVNIALTI